MMTGSDADMADLKETCARITNLCVTALGGIGTKSHEDLSLALKELVTAVFLLEDLVVRAAGMRDQEALDGLYLVCREFATHIQDDGLVKIQTLPVSMDEVQ